MRKFFLYGVNGVINTVVSYAIYVLLIRVIDYRFAVIVSYSVGIVLSYFLNGAIVFGATGRFWLFAVVSLFLMMINLTITWSLVEGFRWMKEVAQLPAIGVVFVLGFLVNKRFVFAPKPNGWGEER